MRRGRPSVHLIPADAHVGASAAAVQCAAAPSPDLPDV